MKFEFAKCRTIGGWTYAVGSHREPIFCAPVAQIKDIRRHTAETVGIPLTGDFAADFWFMFVVNS